MGEYSLGMRQSGSALEDGRIRRLSLEEWIDLPDGEPGEWVDGWLVEEEVTSLVHDLVATWLGSVLLAWAARHGGLAAGSNVKFVVSDRRGRKPDQSVLLTKKNPPEMAVEVLSPGERNAHRDRVEKFAEYAQFGVRLYWIVDPIARTLEVFELKDGSYALLVSASAGRVEIPGCEGLVLDLDELWMLAERAKEMES